METEFVLLLVPRHDSVGLLLWNGKLLCLTVKISIRFLRTSAKLDQICGCVYLITLQQRGKSLRLVTL
ncbi:hypothetical protein ACS0TY_023937 [Phlomoides rotata]